MRAIRRAAYRVIDQDHPKAAIDRSGDGAEDAHVGLTSGDDQRTDVLLFEMALQRGVEPRRIAVLVDDQGRRAKRLQFLDEVRLAFRELLEGVICGQCSK